MDKDFLGIGIKMPFDLKEEDQAKEENSGKWEWANYEVSIEESVYIILQTIPGERLMRPNFGCGLHHLIGKLNTEENRNKAAQYVKDALEKWEPRLEIQDVIVKQDEYDNARMNITINSKIISINSKFNRVYPFYVEKNK